MEKKLPIIHSKMVVKMRRTGPTKKKMPLCPYGGVSAFDRRYERKEGEMLAPMQKQVRPYTTGVRPLAPPHPIKIIAKVIVEITKL